MKTVGNVNLALFGEILVTGDNREERMYDATRDGHKLGMVLSRRKSMGGWAWYSQPEGVGPHQWQLVPDLSLLEAFLTPFDGFRFVPWAKAKMGDVVWINGTHMGRATAYGPHYVVSNDPKKLVNMARRHFRADGEFLLVPVENETPTIFPAQWFSWRGSKYGTLPEYLRRPIDKCGCLGCKQTSKPPTWDTLAIKDGSVWTVHWPELPDAMAGSELPVLCDITETERKNAFKWLTEVLPRIRKMEEK